MKYVYLQCLAKAFLLLELIENTKYSVFAWNSVQQINKFFFLN